MGRKSRQKGKRGERELAHFLNALLGCHARRGQQRSGIDQADVIDAIPGTHIECKLYAGIGAMRFLEQAERDAKSGEIPLVIMRENKGSWVAMLRLARLPSLALTITEMLLEKRNEGLCGKT